MPHESEVAAHARWDGEAEFKGSGSSSNTRRKPCMVREQRRRGNRLLSVLLAIVGSLLSADAKSSVTLANASHGIDIEVEAKPLVYFYDCTVAGDDVMFATKEECIPACYAGTCELKQAEGHFSTSGVVTLEPNTPRARRVVYVTLSPVILVGDPVSMVIRATQANGTVEVEKDPGLPIGMNQTLNAAESELTVSWVPHVGQEGFVHEVCCFSFGCTNVVGCTLSCLRSVCSCASSWLVRFNLTTVGAWVEIVSTDRILICAAA